MKTNYIPILIIVLFLTGTGLFAQGTTNLTPIDDFTYQEHSTTIKIEENNNVEAENFTSNNQTKAASSGIGETEGALSVSLTGAAVYTVPISVPPGITGVEPTLALTYNSQAGNAMAGWGWSMSGASTITRIPATEYHDGIIDGVDFDSSDRFALDGQRLVLKSGAYGTNGAQYQTESYSNVKIISYGQSPMGASSGPSYFEVNYPDGSKALYGKTTNSRSRLEYAITYYENPLGIRISYTYITAGNMLYLKQISYGAKGTGTAINKVIFQYGERTKPEISYVGDVAFTNSMILKEINVIGDGVPYRNYYAFHQQDALDYDILEQIIEKTGDNSQAHSPINFTYNYNRGSESVDYSLITANLPAVGIEQRTSEVVTMDLTGNGRMDFIIHPKTNDEFRVFKNQNYESAITVDSGEFEKIVPMTLLNDNNNMISGQGFTIIKHNSSSGQAVLKAYSNGASEPLTVHYEKTWNPPTYSTDLTCFSSNFSRIIPQEYVSGDFNGDGLTDIVAIPKEYTSTDCKGWGSTYCQCNDTNNTPTPEVHFIDMDRRKTTGFVTNSGVLQASYISGDRLLAADVNGDGKTDLLHFTTGKVYVYSFDMDTHSLQLLWQSTNTAIKTDMPILLGDYNGDGKTDFLTPSTDGFRLFYLFTATGTSFIGTSGTYAFTYNASTYHPITGKAYTYNLIPIDINGDGKTDIISHNSSTNNDGTDGYQQITMFKNNGMSASSNFVGFEVAGSYSTSRGQTKHYPLPIFLSSDQPNNKLEFATISDRNIHSFSYNYDHKLTSTIQTITQNDTDYSIRYSDLDPFSDSYPTTNVYSSDPYQMTYPYVDIVSAPTIKLVRTIEKSAPNVSRYQNYYYKGGVSHLGGLGFMGFKYIARSNWYPVNDTSQLIYTNTTRDLQLRGAVTDQYKTPYTHRFGTIPSDYITHTNTAYDYTLGTNKVFRLEVDTSTHQNQLLGTTTTTQYQYDSYGNPTNETVNYSGKGSMITELTYNNNTSTGSYSIGRPSHKKVTSTIGTKTFSTEEQYTYSGYLLTALQVKGNDTEFNTETYTYDNFGNVIETTTTPYGEVGRTISATYDSSGRFMTEATDVEGLTSTYAYNTATGFLTKETNPFNQSIHYTYDVWNRIIGVTDDLGISTTTTYTETDLRYQVTTESNDGSATITQYDPLGRIQYIGKKSFGGEWIRVTYDYDMLDRLTGQSEPHFGSSPTQWNTTSYDFYGRVSTQELYTGQTITYTYDKLTTTVNDGVKTVSTEKNPMGQDIFVIDSGESIALNYYGNGALRSVGHFGVNQLIEQDGWGRRTKLTDPSGGVYTYEYNGFGEVTKETTPKGSTTYEYLPNGRLQLEKSKGDLTDMTTYYTYDSSSKLLVGMAATDAITGSTHNYTYDYDSDLRPSQITEITSNGTFTKKMSYDAYARIQSETHTAQVGGQSSTMLQSYTYDTSGMYTGISGDWTIKGMNEREQPTLITFGSDTYLHQKNYDAYGYTKGDQLGSTNADTYDIKTSYSFNTARGTLSNRIHETNVGNVQKYEETFTYDAKERLTVISGPFAQTKTFDTRGRITSDTNIGEYAYASGDHRYQIKDITLNNNGEEYFENRIGQEITYNAHKKPVEIYEQGKGRVSFAYGPMMDRTQAWYGGEQTTKEERRYHKIYSSIIPVEVVYDREADSYKFISFKGGDAYTAPMVQIELFTDGSSDGPNQYYLHRDHLGSIINILKQEKEGAADTSVTLVESRQFGAWGTIDAFWSSENNTDFGYNNLIDRGYTGHEHFFDVGLIHMNGRMYDPNLGRFLSPDNYIQNPYDTQNYNRYSYVLNNPLKYTDPSGELAIESVIVLKYAIAAIAGYKIFEDTQVGSWIGNNIDSAWDGITNLLAMPFSLFSRGSSESATRVPRVVETSQNYASADPMIAPNPGIGDMFVSAGNSYLGGQLSHVKGMWNGLVNIVTNPSSMFTGEAYMQRLMGGAEMSFPMLKHARQVYDIHNAAATGDINNLAHTMGGQMAGAKIEALSIVPGAGVLKGLSRVGRTGSKIVGTAQKTGTRGHAFFSNLAARFYSLNPNVVRVTLDRGYRSLMGNLTPKGLRYGPRPDVGVLYKNGKVRAIEIGSKTDVLSILRSRNRDFLNLNGIKTVGINVYWGARLLNKIFSK
ncbi:RHS repeat-associated core domain-containing protein [Aquimarina pacifica]|uniref:RHS repeat-associated core domain-containing protein n=1 Tax=Aquimarina pacifica TaxID=1296415 RepID=UPI000470E318|nr:RHS repeat-associated core domain-containing protein [Aquimarina pacifica]